MGTPGNRRWSLASSAFFLLCVGLSWRRCGGCFSEEREALLSIKAEFSNLAALGWGETADCCSWERVACAVRTGRVEGIDLSGSNKGMTHVLNATMFLPFRHLRNLYLNSASLSGCVPDAGFQVWTNLHKLQTLDLSDNDFNESCVSTLVQVSSLRSLSLSGITTNGNLMIQQLSRLKLHILDLSWNSIHANFSDGAICNMRNLEQLYLSRNQLFGEIPSCIRSLSSLKVLDLLHNRLTIKFPTSIFANLTSLEGLYLSDNQLKGMLHLGSFSNHHQLKHFLLSSNTDGFQVLTENPAVNLSSQLNVLELPNCNLNKNSGVIPSFLWHQSRLLFIDMSSNGLSGYFPTWLIENNANLEYLDFKSNSFAGPLVLPSKANKKLSWFDVSHNKLRQELPIDINVIFPNLEYLNLSNNIFQGVFPSGLSNMDNLFILDLSNNKIRDAISTALSSISGVFLSNNSFYGSLPQMLDKYKTSCLMLNDNNISGEIPTSICDNIYFSLIDASNNNFTGTLPECLGRMTGLQVLNLRGNGFVGSIPLGLSNMSNLQFLDLSKNNLSGLLPFLPNVKFLHLSENSFTGRFPQRLTNDVSATTIDLRYNQFSGPIPSRIAEDFKELIVLLLQGNMFDGMIPYQLCYMKHLCLLDLSHNKLSGEVPSCLSNMGSDGHFDYYYLTFPLGMFAMDVVQTSLGSYLSPYTLNEDQEEFTTKSRQDYYKGSILRYMSGIDFSSNQLVGSIPEQLGSMTWLLTLNFSNNYLNGSIPKSLSNLSNLESLDLSHNYLTGQIPVELQALHSLEVFSVAYNNLSGPTLGTKDQFITFGQSSYEGNPNLCGLPLFKSCSSAPPGGASEEDDGDRVALLILLGSSALFYVVGFWSCIAVLCFRTSWRLTLFLAADKLGDFAIIKLAVIKRKIGSIACPL